MRVEPINCFRPVPERAGRFSAPPYDVLDDAQARAYVAERPDSFMAIDRPETAFDSEHDPYAPEVYQYPSSSFWCATSASACTCTVSRRMAIPRRALSRPSR